MPRRSSTLFLAALIAGLLTALGGCGSGGDGLSVSPGEPELISASQLSEFAGDADTPVYWLGERIGAEYELTETSSGRVYVRYLQGEAEVGDPRSRFDTVATYPSENGVAKLRRAARGEPSAELIRAADGATLLSTAGSSSVYLAYPGSDVQVEVYSPKPGQALRLASAGAVREVR